MVTSFIRGHIIHCLSIANSLSCLLHLSFVLHNGMIVSQFLEDRFYEPKARILCIENPFIYLLLHFVSSIYLYYVSTNELSPYKQQHMSKFSNILLSRFFLAVEWGKKNSQRFNHATLLQMILSNLTISMGTSRYNNSAVKPIAPDSARCFFLSFLLSTLPETGHHASTALLS